MQHATDASGIAVGFAIAFCRRVGTRGAGGLQPPLALKQGGSAPLKIDLVNHIQYAYSHSLLQSRLAMTVYTAIKAQ